jgi:uncharacterized membrane protein YvbJ
MAVKCTKECGYESPKDMDFCPRCGKEFGTGETQREPAAHEAKENHKGESKAEHKEHAYHSPTLKKK